MIFLTEWCNIYSFRYGHSNEPLHLYGPYKILNIVGLFFSWSHTLLFVYRYAELKTKTIQNLVFWGGEIKIRHQVSQYLKKMQ